MTETFSLSLDQARAYERRFVPAIFAQWAPWVVDSAGVRQGSGVLDVGCGTGVLARAAAQRAGDTGHVAGVDLNRAMVQVAAELRPDLDWRQADATDLPFPDAWFDFVLCQSASMFFPDLRRALGEMVRVAVPGGTVANQSYAALEDQPAYGRFVAAAVRCVGEAARPVLGSYWSHGDADAMCALFHAVGLGSVRAVTRLGTARFGSAAELVQVEVGGTPLAARVSEADYVRLTDEVATALEEFTGADGSLALPIRALLVIGRRG